MDKDVLKSVINLYCYRSPEEKENYRREQSNRSLSGSWKLDKGTNVHN